MKKKPVIGITMGDFNGIGPEITLKAIASPVVRKICTPVLVGSIDVYEHYARLLGQKILFSEVERPSEGLKNCIQVVNCIKYKLPRIKYGKLSKEAGAFAGVAILMGMAFLSSGEIDGIVTAPVSKEALHEAGFNFPGQTEILASLTRGKQFMMMLIAGSFRVGLATIHVPISTVADLISKKMVLEKLTILNEALKNDFAIRSPRIAVLGLNPHAGEHGQIGTEEIDKINPALKQAKRLGFHVEGTFPADGFFGKHEYKKYDAVLAMYHDQGLIPLKMQGFDIGVNVTVGLPIVRTSPDHGTAFDIAGTCQANPSSMIEAIKLAVEIVNNRNKRTR